MEQELDFVTLEDGKQYAIIDEITENNITYVYLSNISNETDFCIRKVKEEPKGKMLTGLKDDAEFDQALIYYANKNNG